MERTYLIEAREKRGLTRQDVSNLTRVCIGTIRCLEESEYEVTSPKMADRIGKLLKLTEEQTENLYPENYRKGIAYDPDKYKSLPGKFTSYTIKPERRQYNSATV